MPDFQDFAKLDIRAGIIVKAEVFERARKPAYRVWVDFGTEIGIKATSAQITQIYRTEELLEKRVLGLVNIGERNIAGFISQFLLLGLPDSEDRIHLATFDNGAPLGAKLC